MSTLLLFYDHDTQDSVAPPVPPGVGGGDVGRVDPQGPSQGRGKHTVSPAVDRLPTPGAGDPRVRQQTRMDRPALGLHHSNWAALWLIADFAVATGTPVSTDRRGGERREVRLVDEVDGAARAHAPR